MSKKPSSDRRGKRGFVQTGALLSARIRGATERRGFAETRLLTQWETICGPDIAAIAQPLKVSYARDGFGATLTVACDGARAPEVQMQGPVIREKVNACYGYNAISRVRITQLDSTGFAEAQAQYTPQPETSAPGVRPAPPKEVDTVGDPSLRQALAELGQNIRSRHGTIETGD